MSIDIKRVQTLLEESGFNPGPIDGINGELTKAAAERAIEVLQLVVEGNTNDADVLFIEPARHVEKVFIHCSASDNPAHDDVSVMREWHIKRGWSDVGYHYFIRKDGAIQHGRSVEYLPAAQAGHNSGSIAICLHGLEKDNFTEAQFAALKRLCGLINAHYEGLTFHGHCEVSNKSCPVFDYRAALALNEEGVMTA